MAAVNFLWMPGEFVPGDPSVWYEEARSVLLRGELNVAADWARPFGEPGQYFVRNERTGLYYSKYGVANALFVLPPMWLQQALGGDLSRAGPLPSLFLFNLWYIALATVLSALLYVLTGRYSSRVGVRVVFVLAVHYCTFLWFYQRAQSSELYQAILFTALFLSLTSFLATLREQGTRGLDRRAWIHLAIVWSCIALLVLTRVVYGMLIPLVMILVAYALKGDRGGPGASVGEARGLAAGMLLPPLVIIGLLGLVNHVKFGAPWLTGYHQWRPDLVVPGRLTDGLWGFLFSPRFSLFLYFPLVLFALPGWRRFLALHRLDAIVALTLFVPYFLFVSSLPSWAGEWAYGPRYLLLMLPVLSLPALVFAERALERPFSWRAGAWSALAAACLLYSAFLQVQVNRLPFFAYYQVRTIWNSSVLVAYFYDRHVGAISADLLRHRGNLDGLPYFDELKRAAPADYVATYRKFVGDYLNQPPNLYWTTAREKRT